MAAHPTQNFDNHKQPTTSLTATAFFLLLGALMALIGLFFVNSTVGVCLIGTGVVIQGLATIAGLVVARTYATKLQDRIIRTEMRIRLGHVLPDDLKARIPDLTVKQLIGLRFASDAELPELTRKVLDEKIEKATPIKKMVKDWQPDFDRV